MDNRNRCLGEGQVTWSGQVIGQVTGQVMGQVTGQVTGQVVGISHDLEKRKVDRK